MSVCFEGVNLSLRDTARPRSVHLGAGRAVARLPRLAEGCKTLHGSENGLGAAL